MTFRIAHVVVGLPLDQAFDYLIPQDDRSLIRIGQRVRVLFNQKTRLGVVVGLFQNSRFKKLNSILAILDQNPSLNDKALQFTQEISDYYGCSWGEAIETYLPKTLRKPSARLDQSEPLASSSEFKDVLSQQDHILLHDWRGTGRWPFILKAIQDVLSAQQNVIFLVPEKSMIEDIKYKLQTAFKDTSIVSTAQELPGSQEIEQWQRIQRGEVGIVIGTRSAIFSPTPRLGLIVLYEEDYEAYKQDQLPHYHAREICQMRAKIEGCRIIFVSSVPSVEAWFQSQKKGWQRISLDSKEEHPQTSFQIVDMTNYNPQRSSILSFPLQNRIQKCLENKGKVILFMNRRGFSTLTQCSQCGFTLKCERCDTSLIYMYSKKILLCRHCNYTIPLPKVCPQCHKNYLRSTGSGIEKLESEVARLYPHVRVSHYDKESKSWPTDASIVIATQAMLRQEEIKAQLIAILQFDTALSHGDFRSGERAFSLLMRLRRMAEECLLVQTRMRDNECLKAASKMNFDQFYQEELKLRRELKFPPYQHFIAIELRAPKEDSVLQQSQELFRQLSGETFKKIEVLDAHANPIPKLRDTYRYTIMLRSRSVKPALSVIKKVLKNFKRKSGLIITINVDP